MKITRIKLVAGVASSAFVTLGTAYADLYISPVKDYHPQQTEVSLEPRVDASHLHHDHGYSIEDGDYIWPNEQLNEAPVQEVPLAEVNDAKDTLLAQELSTQEPEESKEVNSTLPCYGKDVPLDIAIRSILGEEYAIHAQDGHKETKLSWVGNKDCITTADIIDIINSTNSAHLTVNHEEQIVGVAGDAVFSEYFAHSPPQIWHADSALSITENLTKWVESVGWKVEWPDLIREIDFETADTTLYGPLIGEGALFHTVLKQIADRYPNVILSVEFYPNKYIVVREGGFTRK